MTSIARLNFCEDDDCPWAQPLAANRLGKRDSARLMHSRARAPVGRLEIELISRFLNLLRVYILKNLNCTISLIFISRYFLERLETV